MIEKIKTWFKEHQILGHLMLIALVFAALTLIAYLAMDWGTRHSARRAVPNFVGLAMEDANHFAERRDLEIIANDSLYVSAYPGGVVLDQHPVEGTIVKPGRKVYVTISSINQRKAVVPFVAKRTLRQALNLLETAGFTIDKIQYVRDMATNYVLAEFVNGVEIVDGSTLQANVGSGVVLRVGVAAKASAISVPDLSGLTVFEAKNRLWESGLNVGEVLFDVGIPAIERSNAKVYYQSVKPFKMVWYGESVSIRLSINSEAVEESQSENKKLEDADFKAKAATDTLSVEEQNKLDSITAAKARAVANGAAESQAVTEHQPEAAPQSESQPQPQSEPQAQTEVKTEPQQ